MAVVRSGQLSAALAALIIASTVGVAGQTVIKLPKNKFTPEQDVALGRKGAEEVRQQFPIIRDERITDYLTKMGDRLVAAAPPELNNAIYEYSFTPVNLKEINAFALPGGPMFVHRGMFDAAAGEGEVIGVMAHELAHVLLRHGTANVTKAQNPWLQLGQVAGAIGGAMVGGAAGSAIAQGSQFGLGTLMLRYGRDFEKQADLLGAQIMSRAGYDPRDLGRMFETIEKESKAASGGKGSGTPQWLSSHPNPGNRTVYINKEAESLTIGTPADTSGFTTVKSAFASLPAARTMGEVARGAKNDPGGDAPKSVGTPGQPVPAPSSQFRTVSGGKVFQASVPSNWTALSSSSSIKVVPENGYGQLNGQQIFSHGIEFGIAKADTRDLKQASNAWFKAIMQANPELKVEGAQQPLQISQRSALRTAFLNPSPLGGDERVVVYTTFLVDGTLFYYLTVVPTKDADRFEDSFQKITESIKLTDSR
jgi:Zn-dependent protease with chaperone function